MSDGSELRREVRDITAVGEWLNWRRHDLTASRIAALFDAHPYLTREQLAADLRGERHAPTAAMRRGRILEPAVAAAIVEDRPEWTLAKATTYHRLPDHRLAATPDYWIGDDGLVQVKTVAPAVWESWQGRPPFAYTLQTLTEMLCAGRPWGVLAVMVAGGTFPVHYFDVPRHAAAEQKILDAAAAWWRAWDAGEIAAPAETPNIDDGSHRDLSGDNLLPALLVERAELKATASAAEKRLKEIDYEVKNRIGSARTAWLPGWSLSFATQRRKETVIAAAEIRVLRIKATMETADAE